MPHFQVYACHIPLESKEKYLSVSKQNRLVYEGNSRYCQSKMVKIHSLFKLEYQYLSSIVNASASDYISNLSRKIIKHRMHERVSTKAN